MCDENCSSLLRVVTISGDVPFFRGLRHPLPQLFAELVN
jgi:hypothetical protein